MFNSQEEAVDDRGVPSRARPANIEVGFESTAGGYVDQRSARKPITGRDILAKLDRFANSLLALLMLVAFAPLFLYIAYAVRRTGPGVFFGHPRIGKNGRVFTCYKFRTMVPNAEAMLEKILEADPARRAEWEADFKLRRDPRITRIGRFLRKTSLDELPQLWNVVRGDMNLVGPRPIVSGELAKYGEHVRYYLDCKPGLTGLWQVSGRNDTSYARRVLLDSWYARNRSFRLDLSILLRTVLVVICGKGAY